VDPVARKCLISKTSIVDALAMFCCKHDIRLYYPGTAENPEKDFLLKLSASTDHSRWLVHLSFSDWCFLFPQSISRLM
jgi:hypothetical protein